MSNVTGVTLTRKKLVMRPKKDITPEVGSVPLNLIDTDFKNTRSAVDPKVVKALKVSIKESGLINPICLNKKGDGRYSVIAGFTRFQAVSELGLDSVNARIYKGLDNRQCLEIGMSENAIRQDLSISQQLLALKRIATEIGHTDTKTLAARLMYSKQHVNSLLKVMLLPDFALQAIDKGDIQLGHGAYLSQLIEINGGANSKKTHELIKNTIAKIRSEGWSVDVLKQKVVTRQIELASAKFDVAQICKGCPHNSSTFGSLFDFDNDKGLCSKPSCFKKHSEDYLNERKALAEERFGSLVMYSNVAMDQISKLSKEALGENQFAACGTCDDHVSILDDTITSKTFGSLSKKLCRNKKCFQECAAKHKKSQKQAASAVETKEPSPLQENKVEQTITQSQGAVTLGGNAVEATKPAPKNEVNISQVTAKQELLSQKTISKETLKKINDSNVTQIVMGFALMKLAGVSDISSAIKKNPLLLDGAPKDAIGDSYKYLVQYLSGCDSSEEVSPTSPRGILLELAKCNPDSEQILKDSWNYKEHLELYTTNAVVQICKESGFVEHYGKDSFAKILKLTKKEFLQEIYKADWAGWVDYYPAGHKKSNA